MDNHIPLYSARSDILDFLPDLVEEGVGLPQRVEMQGRAEQ